MHTVPKSDTVEVAINACYAKTDSAIENGLEVSDEIAAIELYY